MKWLFWLRLRVVSWLMTTRRGHQPLTRHSRMGAFGQAIFTLEERAIPSATLPTFATSEPFSTMNMLIDVREETAPIRRTVIRRTPLERLGSTYAGIYVGD